MRAERGIDLAPTTLMRWVQHYVPKFAKHWQRYARPVERSWRIDETYSSTKRISRSKGNGCTCIARWIGRDRPLIFS